MVNMKNLVLVLLASAFLVFAGCSGDSSAKSSGYSGDAFEGGTEAVSVEFAEGAPPERVLDNGRQPFNVRLMMENNGEYDIPENELYVVLAGISPADFGLTESDIVQTPPGIFGGVEKIKDNVKPGRKQVVTFSNLKYVPSLPSGTQDVSLVVDMCYPYKTTALAKVCINGDTLTTIDDGDKICELDEKKPSESSGAPVIVENVEQFVSGDGIQIQFDIVHEGDGRVYKKDILDSKCEVAGESVTSSNAAIEENFVYYEVNSGISGLDCGGSSASGMVQLNNGVATVFCNQPTVGEGEYEKPITIELSYDYFERQRTSVVVEHTG